MIPCKLHGIIEIMRKEALAAGEDLGEWGETGNGTEGLSEAF